MKSRRVVITVEVKSATPIKDLKEAIKDLFGRMRSGTGEEVLQIQANVIKEEK